MAAARGDRPFAYSKTEKVLVAGARGGVSEGVALHSLRVPGVLAEQEVLLGLPGQTLSIAHRTTSRECYVPGVLMAVRRVAAEPRFYRGLEPLLGLS
jgi:4-hydroxy-tetrahydrodipicolinate reductase